MKRLLLILAAAGFAVGCETGQRPQVDPADAPPAGGGAGATTEGLTAASGNERAATVEIVEPRDGQVVAAHIPVPLRYRLRSGPDGGHGQITVDGAAPAPVRDPQGVFRVPALAAGEHTIVLREMTAMGEATGREDSISVTAQ